MDTENHKLILKAVHRHADTITNEPNLLLQKWCMPEFCAETKLNLEAMKSGDMVGLVSLGVTYGAVVITKESDSYVIKLIHGKQYFDKENASAEDIITEVKRIPLSVKEIYFNNTVKKIPSTEYNQDGPYTFPVPAETISLGYSLDGRNFEDIYSYPSMAGRWVGVKNGLFCCHESSGEAGEVRVSYFHFV